MDPQPQVLALSEASSVALDLARGSAAQMVVVGHGLIFFGIARMPWIQNSAVLAFFILSGFIIPYSTYRKMASDSDYRFAHYFFDRFARIYVGFVPALVFVALADFLMMHFSPANYPFSSAFDLKSFVGNLLMLQDHPLLQSLATRSENTWLAVTSFGSARPFWTVAIEWWIYLAFGWVALSGRSRLPLNEGHRGRTILRTTVLLVLSVVPIYNLIGGRGHGLTMVWLLGLTVFYLLDRMVLTVSRRSAFFGACAFLGFAALRLARTHQAYDLLFGALLAGAMLLGLSGLQQISRMSRWVPTRTIRFNASFSYSLYLVHYSILVALAHLNGRIAGWILLVLGLVISSAVAFVLSRAFEVHYRPVASKFKSRFASQA